jgi:hypothetical protein
VVEQDFTPVGTAPAVEVLLLPWLTTEAAPEHAETNAELSSELGPGSGMAEGVGRVQHLGSAAEPPGISLTGEEITYEGFARRDQLVREHVPGADLERASADQLRDPRLLVGTDPEIVLKENSLTIEQKGDIWLGFKPGDEIIQGWDKSRQEDALREVPFPVPVGMRDQVEGVPGHCRES